MPLQIFPRCYPSSFSQGAVVARWPPTLRLCRTISPKVQSELQRRGRLVVSAAAHVVVAAAVSRELLHYDKVAADWNGNRNAT